MNGDQRRGVVLAAGAFGLGAYLALRAASRRREIDLRGRSVLIMGGSRGLGLVLAREFARSGSRLAITARSLEELERAEADLSARGAEVLTVPCDVTDRSQVERAVQAASERFGEVDLLVNNAGIIQVGPAETMTLADFEEAMKVHLWGPLYAIQAVLPRMRARHFGRIVNISSIGGKISVPHLLPYSTSKFALVGLSEGLRAELAKDGIVVTTVCPGLMRTGSTGHALFKGNHALEHTLFALSDSLPGATVSAEHAARQIVAATRRGDAELIISLPAVVAAKVHGAAPGLTADFLGLINRALPEPGAAGTESREGREAPTPLSESPLTLLSQRAARANNELG